MKPGSGCEPVLPVQLTNHMPEFEHDVSTRIYLWVYSATCNLTGISVLYYRPTFVDEKRAVVPRKDLGVRRHPFGLYMPGLLVCRCSTQRLRRVGPSCLQGVAGKRWESDPSSMTSDPSWAASWLHALAMEISTNITNASTTRTLFPTATAVPTRHQTTATIAQ